VTIRWQDLLLRRSLGTKPGVLPPKRVRASQESSGIPSIVTAPRQSRSSTTGMSTGKRVSSVSSVVDSSSTVKRYLGLHDEDAGRFLETVQDPTQDRASQTQAMAW